MGARGPKPTPDEEKLRVIQYVLDQVRTGRHVLRVFREDREKEQLCDHATFWRWIDDTEDMRDKLVRAREAGVEALLDETLSIADDGSNDTYVEERDDGSTFERINYDVIQRSKLRIETRIKLAQMLKPKTYGPKLDLTSGGKEITWAENLKMGRQRADELLEKRAKGEE
jgi:hypothetical protein